MRSVSIIYAVAIAIFVFLTWAWNFNIDEAVRAQGTVVPVGRVQVVQVADGGVLAQLMVAEGDRVQAGQVIAHLDNTRAAARRDELDAKLAALTVARTRAEAEAEGHTPNFAQFPADWRDVVTSQRELYTQKQTEHSALLRALQAALDTTQREFDVLSNLSKSGDTSNLRLIQSEKELAQRQRELSEAQLKFKTAALTEIAQIDQDLFTLRFQLQERESMVDMTSIIAPKDGIISSLAFTTIGAAIAPGQEFASIAPTNEDLIIEAKIQPVDVGRLITGLPVAIKLDAFDAAIYGNFKGDLTLISADATTEQNGGVERSYFKAQVVVDWTSNNKVDLTALRPGMTATLDLITGERSVLTYLLKPILRGVDGVFIER